jgi:DNA-binding CsgD family transcriptional regulator
MKNYEKVPWLKVHDYLLQVGSCRTIPELMHTACTEVESLIPFDAAVGFHRTMDVRVLDGIGLADAVKASYNDYYRTRSPGVLGADGKLDFRFLMSTSIVDWREYGNLEFAMDFMLPNRMCRSLAHVFPTQQITLTVQRSRRSPDFTEEDVTILDLLNLHLNIYWSFLVESEGANRGPAPSGREIRERFHVLTSREVELCSFVALRLSTGEIASRLFISPRTVEKHIEDIFEKLDVHSRDQLRHKLGGKSPESAYRDSRRQV